MTWTHRNQTALPRAERDRWEHVFLKHAYRFFITALSHFYYYRPHPKDGEGDSFSLCVSSHLGRGTLAISGWEEGIPQPCQDKGDPSQGWGTLFPHPEMGYSKSRDGVPPCDRTTDKVLDTRRAVSFSCIIYYCSHLAVLTWAYIQAKESTGRTLDTWSERKWSLDLLDQ